MWITPDLMEELNVAARQTTVLPEAVPHPRGAHTLTNFFHPSSTYAVGGSSGGGGNGPTSGGDSNSNNNNNNFGVPSGSAEEMERFTGTTSSRVEDKPEMEGV